jgi:hypothetical protein
VPILFLVLLLVGSIAAVYTPSSASATSPSSSRARASPESSLNATARFLNWTWFGTGSPCERGGSLTYVAHFAGSAIGGTAPYGYLWEFGDGGNTTKVQNASHTFVTNRVPWNVTLRVTDASGASASDTIKVSPPAFSCPAQLGGPGKGPYLLSLFALSVIGIAAGVGILISRRRRGAP